MLLWQITLKFLTGNGKQMNDFIRIIQKTFWIPHKSLWKKNGWYWESNEKQWSKLLRRPTEFQTNNFEKFSIDGTHGKIYTDGNPWFVLIILLTMYTSPTHKYLVSSVRIYSLVVWPKIILKSPWKHHQQLRPILPPFYIIWFLLFKRKE